MLIYGLRAVALLIYGLMLFPKSKGVIDEAVVDFFEQLENGRNPVPAILAETFWSLSYCRRTSRGRMRGCSQLLCVWFKSHLKPLKGGLPRFHIENEDGGRPLPVSNGVQWPERTKLEWIEWFQHCTKKMVAWRAPWLGDKYRPYCKFNNELWIFLMGLWGIITYSLILVLRQYGIDQFISATHGLKELEFSFDTKEEIDKARAIGQEWRRSHPQSKRLTLGFSCTPDASPEYKDWHRGRIKDMFLPPHKDLQYPIGEDARDELTLKV
ncbi:hypothetical protein CCACVL1_24934 [Corchorus capsularis]|uniref:DUF7745 domain-containing protein n=1 Tax=Corchorus capsularis TaxID=210143 RepID=A0A1R3GMI8_COCAP|nr:hypothetical protein CCACVL1_24934 [Corchorus capsularis]